jgi:hypothetical protein
LDEAIAAPRAFALVERETIPDERDPSVTTEAIRLQRLVRIAAAARRPDAVEENRRVLIEAMAAVYPSDVSAAERRFEDEGDKAARRVLVRSLAIAPANELPNDPRPWWLLHLASDLVLRTWPPKGAEAAAAYLALVLVGTEHPITSEYFNNLARLLMDQGDFAGARALLELPLARYGRKDWPQSVAVMTLNNLAYLLQIQGDLAGARPLCERALAIYEKELGPEHPNTIATRNHLVGLRVTDVQPSKG